MPVSAGVAWCGVVWCGVVWCGVVWCGVEAETNCTIASQFGGLIRVPLIPRPCTPVTKREHTEERLPQHRVEMRERPADARHKDKGGELDALGANAKNHKQVVDVATDKPGYVSRLLQEKGGGGEKGCATQAERAA